MIARLKPGVTFQAARVQLQAALAHIGRIAPPKIWHAVNKAGFTLLLRSYRDTLLGNRTATLLLLQGAVLLVLLIACVNVANLLLARLLGRTHEFAIRLAVGASRAMLARQLLTEAAWLAIPGGLAGFGLGWLAVLLVQHAGFGPTQSAFSIMPDWRVGLFAAGAIGATILLVSLLPIFFLRHTDLHSLLQEGGHSATGGRRTRLTHWVLVVAELGLAVALIASAGLLLHSFVNLQAVNPGFNPRHVLTASVLVPPEDHQGDAALAAFYADILKRVRALPGVTHAGMASMAPFQGEPTSATYQIKGYKPKSATDTPLAYYIVANKQYFKALGIPLLRGRWFNAGDATSGRRVVIVDEMLAHKYFPHQNPIGKQLKALGRWYTIIGAVPTIKTQSLAKPVKHETVYLDPGRYPRRTMTLVMKTRLPPAALIPAVRHLLHDIDPSVSLFDIASMRARLGDQLQDRQATMVLAVLFGGIALALAMLGVYGVLSYSVGQRTGECGIRLALGATPNDLLRLILKEGLVLLGIGLPFGLVLAVALGYVFSSQLFGVAPFDPLTLAGCTVVLSAVTLLACYLPARRAANLDPTEALQS
jgi:putative ABC transport system permease protein